jgi:hypothetical protein
MAGNESPFQMARNKGKAKLMSPAFQINYHLLTGAGCSHIKLPVMAGYK